ncbi:diguanylate cyclase [Actimicrobium antarcticum]|uniref:diguanylate cyclase n=1 Tax=Actimicrobium antarcticum TaxID=1051899 RepID=A0ABP7TAX6_9BURK
MHHPGSSESLIYLVHPNALLAKDTALQLGQLGCPVEVLAGLAALADVIDRRAPVAVVVDLGKSMASASMMLELTMLRQSADFVLVFLSSRGNFESRLNAIHAGADAYFNRPIDLVALIEKLDALIRNRERRPYRVMLVCNDARSADVLRGAGMEVDLLVKPAELFNRLGEYKPELILVDVLLADCSGIDLIRLIRQNVLYLDIPVVCMGAQVPDDAYHLQALTAGADDYLAGSLGAAHLRAAVAGRAERYRSLRGLITRDSLTGLYNHGAIKDTLAREMSLVERSAAPLSMAMLDLDFFKKVNDTWGHPVGDQVIRSLARLLQQQLRRGDIIGRYGGEEFVVVMPGTTLAAAATVLANIGAAFAQVKQNADGVVFHATFSAGVAEAHGHADAESLLRSADAALYQAKHAGRNCVMQANPP